MRVSRTMAYAVQAILQLAAADPSSTVSCGHLARHGHMPERFLLQVLRCLVTHDILISVRGVEGGYRLAKKPKDITLLDLYKAFNIPLTPGIPPTEGMSDRAKTRLHKTMQRVEGATEEELSRLTMADLLNGSK